jgi:hypothetical protein
MLPVVLQETDTWYLALREKHGEDVRERGAEGEVTGVGWKTA